MITSVVCGFDDQRIERSRWGMKLLSFDIEISDVFELRKYEDMDKYAPFHISVAATAVHIGEERIWYSEEEGRPALNLNQKRAHELLEYLDEMQQMGFTVCSDQVTHADGCIQIAGRAIFPYDGDH